MPDPAQQIQFLKDPDPGRRRAATALLGQIAHSAAVGPLCQALDDPDPGVRGKAAAALGQIGDVAALGPLLQALNQPAFSGRRLKDPPHPVTLALARFGETAVPPLIAVLQDTSRSPWARQEAARALGQIGDTRARPSLHQGLSDPDAHVREAATAALGVVGNQSAVAPLCERLRDRDRDVACSAARSLGRIGGQGAADALIATLREDAWPLRLASAEALGRLGDDRAVHPLIEALRDPERPVCEAAIRALGRAAMAMGRTGDRRAIAPLIEVLHHPELAAEAAATLKLVARDNPVPDLRAALPRLRRLARFGISQMTRSRCKEAAAEIETATGGWKGLPIPADRPLPSAVDLPLPSGPPTLPPDDLPIPGAAPEENNLPAAGAHRPRWQTGIQQLRRALRRKGT